MKFVTYYLFQMVYYYKRKSDRAKWFKENLQNALREAQKTTILNASKKYGIPYATLYRHLKSGIIISL